MTVRLLECCRYAAIIERPKLKMFGVPQQNPAMERDIWRMEEEDGKQRGLE
jgi:hypothetical protein